MPRRRRPALAMHGQGRKVSLATWSAAVSDWRPGKRPAIADIPGTTMTLTPEYGEEERMRQQSEGLRQRSEGGLPQDREDAPEREIGEHDREDRELACATASRRPVGTRGVSPRSRRTAGTEHGAYGRRVTRDSGFTAFSVATRPEAQRRWNRADSCRTPLEVTFSYRIARDAHAAQVFRRLRRGAG